MAQKNPRRSSTEADVCFERASRHILANCYDAAVVEFTRLIEIEPRSVRGYLGRADARTLEAAEIVERYRASGGRQFELTFEELNAPSGQSLHPPEKDKWWRLNERIMKLQYESKGDYQKALKLDPHNSHAREMLQSLSG